MLSVPALRLRLLLETVLPAQAEPKAREGKSEPKTSDELLDGLQTEPDLGHGDPREDDRLRAALKPVLFGVATDLVDVGVLVIGLVAPVAVARRGDRLANVVALAVPFRLKRPARILAHPVVDEATEDDPETESRSVLELDVL